MKSKYHIWQSWFTWASVLLVLLLCAGIHRGLQAHPVSLSYGSIYFSEQEIEVDLVIQLEDYFLFNYLRLDTANCAGANAIRDAAQAYPAALSEFLFFTIGTRDTLRARVLAIEIPDDLPAVLNQDQLMDFNVLYRMSFSCPSGVDSAVLHQNFGSARSPIDAMSVFQVYPTYGRAYGINLAKGQSTPVSFIERPDIRTSSRKARKSEQHSTLDLTLRNSDKGIRIEWHTGTDLLEDNVELQGVAEDTCDLLFRLFSDNIKLDTGAPSQLDVCRPEASGHYLKISPGAFADNPSTGKIIWNSLQSPFQEVVIRMVGFPGESDDLLFKLTRYQPVLQFQVSGPSQE